MATLLRIGIIGLKDWLYWMGVLVGSLRCKYSWLKQILKHVILLYPLHTSQEVILLAASIENYNTLLLIQKGLKAATQWLIGQNMLDQFWVTKEIAIKGKGARNRRPLITLQE